MDQIDLKGKAALLGGLKGSGKTNLGRWMVSLDPNHALAYDPEGDFVDLCDTIQPKHHEYPAAADEFARILNKLNVWDRTKHPYRLLVVDEAPNVAPVGQKLNPVISRLARVQRHIPLTVVWITQRPRDLHHRLVNLADHIFVYVLTGATDMRFLDDTYRGMGAMVAGLEQYHVVHKSANGAPEVLSPAPLIA